MVLSNDSIFQINGKGRREGRDDVETFSFQGASWGPSPAQPRVVTLSPNDMQQELWAYNKKTGVSTEVSLPIFTPCPLLLTVRQNSTRDPEWSLLYSYSEFVNPTPKSRSWVYQGRTYPVSNKQTTKNKPITKTTYQKVTNLTFFYVACLSPSFSHLKLSEFMFYLTDNLKVAFLNDISWTLYRFN